MPLLFVRPMLRATGKMPTKTVRDVLAQTDRLHRIGSSARADARCGPAVVPGRPRPARAPGPMRRHGRRSFGPGGSRLRHRVDRPGRPSIASARTGAGSARWSRASRPAPTRQGGQLLIPSLSAAPRLAGNGLVTGRPCASTRVRRCARRRALRLRTLRALDTVRRPDGPYPEQAEGLQTPAAQVMTNPGSATGPAAARAELAARPAAP